MTRRCGNLSAVKIAGSLAASRNRSEERNGRKERKGRKKRPEYFSQR
jgi:hypothetical protein